ncbi:MAG: L-serine ammonia-lyase, iron-sulfur-dependent subunit beta [Oliverpabstia sp.]|nr:L-serine ammonia-lyase, iron-sulfur-dependent subunit beta [Lachnospiraceae bacterium]MDY5027543.1 L-serine ammonia-lyase, iron-sulfur-dependent subunit beta [Oliverpabstia sp.]
MSLISVFDVIGPNMVGPSSSHTAGAASVALMAQKLFQKEIKEVVFTLYGSFAKTYRGHGTDRALVGGIMGFDTDDLRIRDSFQIAQERGLEYHFEKNTVEDEVHPNTVDICMTGKDGSVMTVRGVSVGGGKIKIVRMNGVNVEFTGEYSTLVVIQNDKPGVVAHITTCLSQVNANIAFMRLFREEKGARAYTIVESDEKIPEEVLTHIRKNPNVEDLILIQI